MFVHGVPLLSPKTGNHSNDIKHQLTYIYIINKILYCNTYIDNIDTTYCTTIVFNKYNKYCILYIVYNYYIKGTRKMKP